MDKYLKKHYNDYKDKTSYAHKTSTIKTFHTNEKLFKEDIVSSKLKFILLGLGVIALSFLISSYFKTPDKGIIQNQTIHVHSPNVHSAIKHKG